MSRISFRIAVLALNRASIELADGIGVAIERFDLFLQGAELVIILQEEIGAIRLFKSKGRFARAIIAEIGIVIEIDCTMGACYDDLLEMQGAVL